MHAARVEETIKNTRRKIEQYSHFNTIEEKDVSDDEDDGQHTTPPNLKNILGEDEPSDSLFTSSSSFELFPVEETAFMTRIMRDINTDEDEQNTNEEEANRTHPYVSDEEEELEKVPILDSEEKQRRALDKTVEYNDDDDDIMENDS
jgi:hypothetical protein